MVSSVDNLATADIVRVARDGSALIVKTDGGYTLASVSDPAAERRTATTLDELVSGGRWRRATKADKKTLAAVAVVAAGKVFVDEPAVETAPRQYRVPPTVKASIASALEAYSALLSEDDRQTASRLATHTQVSRSDIEWMHRFFDNIEKAQQLHGGQRGKNWAAKVLSGGNEAVIAAAETNWTVFNAEADNPGVLFVAGGSDPYGEVFDALYMIETDLDHEYPSPETVVYEWKDGEFVPTAFNGESFERDCLIPIDHETAEEFARLLDSKPTAAEEADYDQSEHDFECDFAYSLKDINPEERNLFELAASELDYEDLDRIFTLIADATGYSPVERSVNAQRQPRGAGGRFGGGSPTAPGKTLTAYKKATLPQELPLVENPAQLIDEYIASKTKSAGEQEEEAAPVVASALDRLAAFADEEPAAAEAAEEPQSEAAKAASAIERSEDPLYLAIVDDVDKTAVMDVVAVIPGEDGAAEGWKRSAGEWVSDPDIVADIKGATPPPLVKLEDEAVIKDVLRQVDESDGQEPVTDEVEPETGVSEDAIAASAWELAGPSAEVREKLAKSGEAMPDGSYPIRNVSDLKKAIKAYGRAKNKTAAKKHIKKRARALNRYDLVPEDWKAAAVFEDPGTELVGPFGEVVVAGGVPGIADTPEDFRAVARLKRYWAFGPGALKIRWGTPGDLTRAHRHLAKYVGPERAWGLAQNLHKMVFGRPNPESGRRG